MRLKIVGLDHCPLRPEDEDRLELMVKGKPCVLAGLGCDKKKRYRKGELMTVLVVYHTYGTKPTDAGASYHVEIRPAVICCKCYKKYENRLEKVIGGRVLMQS